MPLPDRIPPINGLLKAVEAVAAAGLVVLEGVPEAGSGAHQ